MLQSPHRNAQVNVRDAYGNAARPAVGVESLGHVSATIGRWVNGTLQIVADSVPLEAPSAETAGVAEASLRLNDTGSYQVTVHIDDARVPGSPYQITVTAGPPSAAATTMQVCLCHGHSTGIPQTPHGIKDIVVPSLLECHQMGSCCAAWTRRPAFQQWHTSWVHSDILSVGARCHWGHRTESVRCRLQRLCYRPWSRLGICTVSGDRSCRHLC
jgi:hypothetical protein